MKIFLVYPAINSPQDIRYNYGLGYIAAILKKDGHNVTYITLKDKKDIRALYKNIKEKRPQITGFSATSSQFAYLRDIAKTIKEIYDTFIACGGIHPTLKPECLFEIPELDAIVRGEGEFPLLELAKAFESKENYFKIKNFWFKKNGGIIKNELRPLIGNLDELPFPDKDSLDYQQIINEKDGENSFIFSRGCTFECTYCSNKALADLYKDKGTYFRLRSPQKAIEEIQIDASKYRFNTVFLDDDTISLNKKWFYDFFTLYKRELKYPFRCNIRPGAIDSGMIRVLKEAGATGVNIGIEHGNEKFRRTVLKRNVTNKQIIDTFRLCEQNNLRFNLGQIMVGLPFESKKLFFDTVRLCREVNLIPSNGIYIFHPYPGTELGRLCEKNNWLPDRKYYREREEAVVDYPGFSKKEIQLCHDVFPLLMRFKNLRFDIPLEPMKWLSKLYRMIIILRYGIGLRIVRNLKCQALSEKL